MKPSLIHSKPILFMPTTNTAATLLIARASVVASCVVAVIGVLECESMPTIFGVSVIVIVGCVFGRLPSDNDFFS